MRRLTVAVFLGVLFVASVVSGQSSLLEGTWKLNAAKSTFKPGPAPKSQIITWKRVAGGYQFTTDTVNAQGEKSHSETLEKDDGSDGQVSGSTPPRTRRLKKIDDHTYEDADTSGGKVVTKRRNVISSDGRTITSTQTGTNARGQAVNNVAVYEKQ